MNLILSFIRRFYSHISSKYIYRFSGGFLALLSISIIIFGVASYKMSSSVVIQDYLNYRMQINDQIVSNLEESIDNLSRQSMASLLLVQDFRYIITTSLENADDQYFNKMNTIGTYFFSLLQSTPKVYGVTVLDNEGRIKFYMDKQNSKELNVNLLDKDWITQTLSLAGHPYFIEPHFNDYIFYNSNTSQKKSIISISRAIKSGSSDNSIMGIIVFDQEVDEFFHDFKTVRTEPGEILALLGHDGDVIYSNSTIDPKLLRFLNKNAVSGKRETVSYSLDDEKMLINISKVSFNLKVVSIIPYSELNNKSNFIWIINFSLLLIVIVLSLIIIFIMSYFFSKPFNQLIASIKKLKKGDFSIRINIKGTHELAQVGSTFNDMVVNINDLIQQKYQANLLRKQAELEFLQSQINPHFLYNTLSSIKNVSDKGECERASQMILNLSDIFRYSLGKGKFIVKFQDELLHVRKYLELLEARFKDIYNVTYDINPDVLEFKILRLTLQPIIENAIYHGLEGIRGRGGICICAKVFEKDFNIYISDSGRGIEQDELNRINSLLENTDEAINALNSEKIGIYNVNARIKLHFGSSYGIRITSTPFVNTTVKIRLPAERDL